MGVRAFQVYGKIKLVKGVLVGLGSHACHVIDDFVYYNLILAIGVTAVQLDAIGGSIVNF